jgi:hypothetical protein
MGIEEASAIWRAREADTYSFHILFLLFLFYCQWLGSYSFGSIALIGLHERPAVLEAEDVPRVPVVRVVGDLGLLLDGRLVAPCSSLATARYLDLVALVSSRTRISVWSCTTTPSASTCKTDVRAGAFANRLGSGETYKVTKAGLGHHAPL